MRRLCIFCRRGRGEELEGGQDAGDAPPGSGARQPLPEDMGVQGSCFCQRAPLSPRSPEQKGVLMEDCASVTGPDVAAPGGQALAKKGQTSRAGGRRKDRVGLRDGSDEGYEPHLQDHRRRVSKTKLVADVLKQGMKQDRVCASFGDRELSVVVDTMECFAFAPGDVVVKQGDTGTYFFVTEVGTLEVSVHGRTVNTLVPGQAFGGLALLYNCPRTATVVAKEDARVWGANGDTFKTALQENAQKHAGENRKYLDSISMFDGLSDQQKLALGESLFLESFQADARVVTEGENATAMYWVKRGELSIVVGATVTSAGKVTGGSKEGLLRPGDAFGERAVLYSQRRTSTIVAVTACELFSLGIEPLREVLGDDLAACLEQSFVLSGLKKSPIMSQFSSTQQRKIVRIMERKTFQPGENIDTNLRFAIVVDGEVEGMKTNSARVTLVRGEYFEDDTIIQSEEEDDGQGARNTTQSQSLRFERSYKEDSPGLEQLTAGAKGCKLAMLSREGLGRALKEMGMSAIGSAEQAMDYTRKMILVKKVAIFRHLAQQQTNDLVRSFVLQRYKRGAVVIKQGEVGSAFFVLASGEVEVLIGGKVVRTMPKNSYFGERALLFDEPRTATIVVSSNKAELWSIEKAAFTQLMGAKMREELEHRIRLQDTTVTLKDLRHVKIVGVGAAGVVRLVRHTKTGTKYALKRVRKDDGRIPEEVTRECDLLAAMDHPFVMHLVKTFETASSVYILTEIITGGELHAAIRKIPTVLSRTQAQFYTGSLVLVLESLQDRGIVYRDLKPENVMLDAQGYLKLIDFGIAKKLEEGKSRTFTMIGTPHYMAPEVMRGHGYGTEVDIWSLGVMLFEFVCGYLPFADELDDPTEVCTSVLRDQLSFPAPYRDHAGRALVQGMLTRAPKKRLGAGINGYEDLRRADFFHVPKAPVGSDLFQRIMGRELDPPVVPRGEQYTPSEEVDDIVLSDQGEFAK